MACGFDYGAVNSLLELSRIRFLQSNFTVFECDGRHVRGTCVGVLLCARNTGAGRQIMREKTIRASCASDAEVVLMPMASFGKVAETSRHLLLTFSSDSICMIFSCGQVIAGIFAVFVLTVMASVA